MTVMADRSGRPAPVRRRMKTLTQAALNADKTVEQVEDVLDGLGKTMAELNSSLSQLNSTVERLEDGLDHLEGTLHSLDDLAKRLIVLVEPVEAIVDRIDYIVSLGETRCRSPSTRFAACWTGSETGPCTSRRTEAGHRGAGGPYAFSRNPMFLGQATIWAGWAILCGRLPVATGLAVFVGIWFVASP